MPDAFNHNNNPNPSFGVHLVSPQTIDTRNQRKSTASAPNTNPNTNMETRNNSLPASLKWSVEEARNQFLAASKSRGRSKSSRLEKSWNKYYCDDLTISKSKEQELAAKVVQSRKHLASLMLKQSHKDPNLSSSVSRSKQAQGDGKRKKKRSKARSKLSASKSRNSSRSEKKRKNATKCFRDMKSIDSFIHKYKQAKITKPSSKKIEEQKGNVISRERPECENKLDGVFEFVKHFRDWKTSRNDSPGSREGSENVYLSSEDGEDEEVPDREVTVPARRKRRTRKHRRKLTTDSALLSKSEKQDTDTYPKLRSRSKKSKKSKISRSAASELDGALRKKRVKRKSRKHKSPQDRVEELDCPVKKERQKKSISCNNPDPIGSKTNLTEANGAGTPIKSAIVSDDHWGPPVTYSAVDKHAGDLTQGNTHQYISTETWHTISEVEKKPDAPSVSQDSKYRLASISGSSNCVKNMLHESDNDNTKNLTDYKPRDQEKIEPTVTLVDRVLVGPENSVTNIDRNLQNAQTRMKKRNFDVWNNTADPSAESTKMKMELIPEGESRRVSADADFNREQNHGVPTVKNVGSSEEAEIENKPSATSTKEDQNTFSEFVDRADKLKERIKSTSRTSDIWDLFDALQDLKNCFTNLDQERHRNKETAGGQTALRQALSSKPYVSPPNNIDHEPIEEKTEREDVKAKVIKETRTTRTWGDAIRDARTLVKVTGDGRVITADGDIKCEGEGNSGNIILTKKNDDPVLSRSWNPSPFPRKDLQAPFDGLSKKSSPHTKEDLYWLKKAIGLSRYATCRDHPFASILINPQNKLVAADINFHYATFELKNHAEMRLLRKAENSSLLVDGFKGCTIYCSTEPCVHCSQVIEKSGIRRIVYGCPKYLMMKIRKSSRDALDWHSQTFDAFWQPAFRYKKDTELVGPLLKEVAADVHRKYWLAYYDGEENKTEFKNKWRLKLTDLWGGDKSCGLLLNNLKED